jgi:hypothetical protein
MSALGEMYDLIEDYKHHTRKTEFITGPNIEITGEGNIAVYFHCFISKDKKTESFEEDKDVLIKWFLSKFEKFKVQTNNLR